ncbi:tumor necrosis factor receptor superfamily member 9 [Liasis olivaceus]
MGRLAWALLLLLLLQSRALPGLLCPTGTFRRGAETSCRQCRVCDRNLAYKQNCTETADAVCECAVGYSCGKNCESCQCPLGQQRTIRGCQNCPEKTFNDQRTGECRPWRKCPDDKIWKPGTKERDVVCWFGSESPTTQSSTSLSILSTKISESGSQLIPISIALVMAILSAICMLLVYTLFRSWIQGKFLKSLHGQLAQEVDDCTYRYPEEEEGGSCEAAASLKGELLEKYYSQDM